MSQTLVSTMMRPSADGRRLPPAWADIPHVELGSGYEVAAAHDPETLFLHVTGVKSGEAVEVLLSPKDRGEWCFYAEPGAEPHVKPAKNSRVPPRLTVGSTDNGITFSFTHIDLAPDNVLAATPVNGEEWGVVVRIFPPGGGTVPVAWLDEGSVLRFSGGRDHKAISLKDNEEAVTGVGLLTIRLDFGATIPQGTTVSLVPKEHCIPVRSKDLSYVKCRIVKAGVYRLRVDIPPLKHESQEENEEYQSGQESAQVTDTAITAGLAFNVPETWKRIERMDDHVRRLISEGGAASTRSGSQIPGGEEALKAFDEALGIVERYRTPQAKGVLKHEEIANLEQCFWRVLAVYRKQEAAVGKLTLISPYSTGTPFIKGMILADMNPEATRQALEKARRLALDFVMVASHGIQQLPSDWNLIAIPGRVEHRYFKSLVFEAGGSSFRVMVPPLPPANALPAHLAAARAVAGDLAYWHEALAAGFRLSYVDLDSGRNEDRGTALVHVQAEKNAESIVKAMREGAFYSRIAPAPEIETISLEGLTVSIKRRPYEGMAPTVFLGRAGTPLGMSPGEQSSYTFSGDEQFVRVQILAGSTQAAGSTINLLTILNPFYCSDWVTPWLDEAYASKQETEQNAG